MTGCLNKQRSQNRIKIQFLSLLEILPVLNEAKAPKGIIITGHLYRQVCAVADDLYLLAQGCTYRITEESQLLERGYLPNSATPEVLF